MSKAILEHKERKKLNKIVAGLDDITVPGNRRVFIQVSAGLGRFISGIDLAGTPRNIAADLIGKLEPFGALPERPTYHALGALLDAILNLEDVPTENKTFIASLIERYSLIRNPKYISNLRKEYNLPLKEGVRT